MALCLGGGNMPETGRDTIEHDDVLDIALEGEPKDLGEAHR